MNVLEFKGFQCGMHLLLWMLWWEAKEATGLGALGRRCGSVSQLKHRFWSAEKDTCLPCPIDQKERVVTLAQIPWSFVPGWSRKALRLARTALGSAGWQPGGLGSDKMDEFFFGERIKPRNHLTRGAAQSVLTCPGFLPIDTTLQDRIGQAKKLSVLELFTCNLAIRFCRDFVASPGVAAAFPCSQQSE